MSATLITLRLTDADIKTVCLALRRWATACRDQANAHDGSSLGIRINAERCIENATRYEALAMLIAGGGRR